VNDLVPTRKVLGVDLALLDYAKAIAAIETLTKHERPSAVSFCNTHLVTEAAYNQDFNDTLARFDINLPDGMPLIWQLNKQGANLKDRVYGPYLMKAFFTSEQCNPNLRHFLFGSTPELLAQLKARLKSNSPTALIVGTIAPPFRPFTEAEEAIFARQIATARADCIWVAMGGVKQEFWIAKNIHRHHRGVFLAVGDAFSLLAGQSTFAPDWIQKIGLTWLYRLIRNPKRLWKRYLFNNTRFIFLSAKDLLTPKKPSS